jgi:tRNA(Arg) A34 adenosine deaminase TadA
MEFRSHGRPAHEKRKPFLGNVSRDGDAVPVLARAGHFAGNSFGRKIPEANLMRSMLISGMAVAVSSPARPNRNNLETTGAAGDRAHMAALARFTARSLKTASPRPFGASIVRTGSGKTLLRALNAVRQEFDPSAHAETRAIRLATKRLKNISLAGYTLYTTCEPCPMCMSAALWAGVDRVVYGATIADANRHCNQILISAVEVTARADMHCVIDGPLLREECYALFTDPRMLRAFRAWSTRKRPTPRRQSRA